MRLLQGLVLTVLVLFVVASAQEPPEIDYTPVSALDLRAQSSVHWLLAPGMVPPQAAVHVADLTAKKVGCSGKGSTCDYVVQVWKIGQ